MKTVSSDGSATDTSVMSMAWRSATAKSCATMPVGARAGLELFGRSQREQLPVIDDREPVAELIGFFHVVRGQQDRLTLSVQFAEDLPEREAALRIQPGGRLVEEQGGRPVHDRPGDHETLRHPTRERRHRFRPAVYSRPGW